MNRKLVSLGMIAYGALMIVVSVASFFSPYLVRLDAFLVSVLLAFLLFLSSVPDLVKKEVKRDVEKEIEEIVRRLRG